jgi:hypothetical protein
LLLARGLDAAQGFGAEVCGSGEVVGEAQEVGEEGEGGGVVRSEAGGEREAFTGFGVFEAVWVLAVIT